jgi:TonB family protein
MKMRIFASILAFLLLLPHLFAGESSPAVKFAVAPKYPALTLAGRIYGQVVVRVTIDRAGAVKGANVTDGHPMLREAAVYAARQWKFVDSPVEKRVAMLKFNFVILPDNAQVQSQTIFLPPAGFEIRQKPTAPAVEDQEGEFTPDQHPISKT